MAIRRPQKRASYSAMLLDAGKCKHTTYLIGMKTDRIRMDNADTDTDSFSLSDRILGSNTDINSIFCVK
jgi:hypothetical protein